MPASACCRPTWVAQASSRVPAAHLAPTRGPGGLNRWGDLLHGGEDVWIVAPLRIEEIGHDVPIVAPGKVLVRSVTDVGDVVAHVGERNDRIELRHGEDPGEGLAAHALDLPMGAVPGVGCQHVQLRLPVGAVADLV